MCFPNVAVNWDNSSRSFPLSTVTKSCMVYMWAFSTKCCLSFNWKITRKQFIKFPFLLQIECQNVSSQYPRYALIRERGECGRVLTIKSNFPSIAIRQERRYLFISNICSRNACRNTSNVKSYHLAIAKSQRRRNSVKGQSWYKNEHYFRNLLLLPNVVSRDLSPFGVTWRKEFHWGTPPVTNSYPGD